MAAIPLDIEAEVTGAAGSGPGERTTVRGQVAVATATGQVESVQLVPGDPPACPEALAAIEVADWIILGPGSWYTSVLPHLLVPDLRRAITDASAKRCVTLNITPQAGETDGFSPNTYLEVLAVHAPDLRVDAVLADSSGVADLRLLEETVTGLGGELVVADVAVPDGSGRHDPVRLAAAYQQVLW
jgi:uncharacterized cofD-like protein